jgi:hypothetical protein
MRLRAGQMDRVPSQFVDQSISTVHRGLELIEFGARKGRLKLKVDNINTETVRQFRIRCARWPPWQPSR